MKSVLTVVFRIRRTLTTGTPTEGAYSINAQEVGGNGKVVVLKSSSGGRYSNLSKS